MTRKSHSKKRRAFVAVLCILVLAIIYNLSPHLIGRVMTSDLRNAFAEQSKIFTKQIASLGITGEPDVHFQCIDEQYTHWRAELICQNFADYAYNESPISETAKDHYPVNAARFDQLLKQNGWINDRPQDAVTTLVESNPYLPQNNDQGGEVPFHKNIGSISCNLEISFNPLNNPNNPAAPGSINVNEFICQQDVGFFLPSLTTWQAKGP